jgi:hypothetical protein
MTTTAAARPARLPRPMNAWRLERLRMTRSPRAIALAGVYLLFGLLGPVTARYLPDIVNRVQSGVQVIVAKPTPKDGIADYISQASQTGLAHPSQSGRLPSRPRQRGGRQRPAADGDHRTAGMQGSLTGTLGTRPRREFWPPVWRLSGADRRRQDHSHARGFRAGRARRGDGLLAGWTGHAGPSASPHPDPAPRPPI